MPFTPTIETTYTVESDNKENPFDSGTRFVFFPCNQADNYNYSTAKQKFIDFILSDEDEQGTKAAQHIDGSRRFCFITDAREDGFYVCELWDSLEQAKHFVNNEEEDKPNMKGFTKKFADKGIFPSKFSDNIDEYKDLPTEEVMAESYAYFKYTKPKEIDDTGIILEQGKVIQMQTWNIKGDKIDESKKKIKSMAPMFKEVNGVESFVVTIGTNTRNGKNDTQCVACTVWENQEHFDQYEQSGGDAEFEKMWRHLLVDPHDVTPVIDVKTQAGIIFTKIDDLQE